MMQITVILVQIQTGRLRVVKATAREGGGFPLATTALRDQLNAKAITIKAVLPPLGGPNPTNTHGRDKRAKLLASGLYL